MKEQKQTTLQRIVYVLYLKFGILFMKMEKSVALHIVFKSVFWFPCTKKTHFTQKDLSSETRNAFIAFRIIYHGILVYVM